MLKRHPLTSAFDSNQYYHRDPLAWKGMCFFASAYPAASYFRNGSFDLAFAVSQRFTILVGVCYGVRTPLS